jgi:serine phosphatase RsbU (regulator of sigma subunit)
VPSAMPTDSAPRGRDQPQWVGHAFVALAVLLPVIVALLFNHPSQRVVTPQSIMLAIAVVLTLVGGRTPGLLAILSSTVSLWFFIYPPGYSFRSVSSSDLVALIVSGAIGAALVLVMSDILQRQQSAVVGEAELEGQLHAQGQTLAQLQRALLPEVVPETAGLSIGWQYVAGGGSAALVGGDWYAFIPVSPTRVGIAVGDVAGHGVHAVTSMAEHRYALRTLAVEGATPGAVLTRLEEVNRLYRGTHFSSCLYGVIDVEQSTWTYSSAGHPPPLLIREGVAQILTSPHGPPIGTGMADLPYPHATVALWDGDLLALYTDGLVERRGEIVDDGIRRLSDRLGRVASAGDLFEASDAVVRELVGTTPADDVALVLVRFASRAGCLPA